MTGFICFSMIFLKIYFVVHKLRCNCLYFNLCTDVKKASLLLSASLISFFTFLFACITLPSMFLMAYCTCLAFCTSFWVLDYTIEKSLLSSSITILSLCVLCVMNQFDKFYSSIN